MDIVIQGGEVVTPWGVGRYDIGIQGEKIVAVQSPATITSDVGRVIDATGKIVIPGGIEPHAHPDYKILGAIRTGSVSRVSRAAVFGGTSTILDFAVQDPNIDIFQAIEESNTSKWQGNSYADYTHHCTLRGAASTDVLSQIREVIKAGFPSFKVYTSTVRPPAEPEGGRYFMAGAGYMSAIMEQVAAYGGVLMVHAEDDDIVMYNHQRLKAENRTEWYNLHLVHDNLSEDLSFRRVIRLAEWKGAAVYFAHTSAKEGVQAIQEARSRGQPVYGETIQNYVTFTAEDYRKPDGQKYHNYPSLKSDEDRMSLWDGLINGGISCMSTDDCQTSLEVKLKGKSIFDTVGGSNGIETRVGLTYSEGVVKRGMSLRRFVDVVSTNAAKIMGLYPRKGAIAPGSDADIVFIDPKVCKKLTMDDLHCGDYSNYEGWEVTGWPVFTMIRGKVMVEGGKLLGNQGYGQLILGKIDPDIVKRPMC